MLFTFSDVEGVSKARKPAATLRSELVAAAASFRLNMIIRGGWSPVKMVYWGTIEGKALAVAHKHGPALAKMILDVGARLAAAQKSGQTLSGRQAHIRLHSEVKPEDFNGAIL